MRMPDERQHLTQAAAPSVRKATPRAVGVPGKAVANAATTVSISAEAPTVDHAKVTRLREAMAASTYVMQPSRIARAMMDAVPA